VKKSAQKRTKKIRNLSSTKFIQASLREIRVENKRLDEGAARDGPNPVVNEAATSIPEDHPRRRKGVDASTPDILRQRGNGL
jgi:hypothetical protein